MEQKIKLECMVEELQEEKLHLVMELEDKQVQRLLEVQAHQTQQLQKANSDKVEKDVLLVADMVAPEVVDGTVVPEAIQTVLEMMTLEAVEDLDMYTLLLQRQIIRQDVY